MTREKAITVSRERFAAYRAWRDQAVKEARKIWEAATRNQETFKSRVKSVLRLTPPPLRLHQMGFCSCITDRLSSEMYGGGGLLPVDYVICKEHASQFKIAEGHYFRFNTSRGYEDSQEVNGILQ